ncbi:Oidioi.mRNA.OKI2018_I69.chr1.g1702.t1.cds [Oikopleura dioica]|uniref:Oidioi.mRNA.OKI2018_I69.chr1.g1702.t1.cds n=1 Tax=Oikopleura dioica TaxID=34765 RepID=A0ABN7SNQ7_OIKDI|nr:Oidioi.mRNA.OKI2018_I69.chr1.g1702.t1.cds [Oikopleura dioica]
MKLIKINTAQANGVPNKIAIHVTKEDLERDLRLAAKEADCPDTFVLITESSTGIVQRLGENEEKLRKSRTMAERILKEESDSAIFIEEDYAKRSNIIIETPQQTQTNNIGEVKREDEKQERLEKLEKENTELKKIVNANQTELLNLRMQGEMQFNALKDMGESINDLRKYFAKKNTMSDNEELTGGSEGSNLQSLEERADESKEERKRFVRTEVKKFFANPAKFNMISWTDNEDITFDEHLARNRIAIRSAKESGLADSQLINLFLLTLRPRDHYLDEVVGVRDRKDFKTFIEGLGRYFNGSSTTSMNKVITARRKPNEKLIEFFIRLRSMYGMTGRDPTEGETPNLFYTILLNNATKIQKTELIRDLDVERRKTPIKLDDLKDAVLKAQMVDDQSYDANTQHLVYNINDQQKQRGYEQRNEMPRSSSRKLIDKSNVVCYNCDSKGHMWRDCQKPLKQRFVRIKERTKQQQGYPREPRTPRGTGYRANKST